MGVTVDRHPIFQRQDFDIYSTVPISFAEAALGGDIRIQTVDGEIVHTIPAGTQTDTRIRLKGKGVPTLRNKNIRGDHYVTLVVKVPERLNHEQKELLKQFDASLNGEHGGHISSASGSASGEPKKKKSFMDKVKEALDPDD